MGNPDLDLYKEDEMIGKSKGAEKSAKFSNIFIKSPYQNLDKALNQSVMENPFKHRTVKNSLDRLSLPHIDALSGTPLGERSVKNSQQMIQFL